MKEVTIKVYEFNELSDKAQQVALNDFREVNLNGDWYVGIQEHFRGIFFKWFKTQNSVEANRIRKLLASGFIEVCNSFSRGVNLNQLTVRTMYGRGDKNFMKLTNVQTLLEQFNKVIAQVEGFPKESISEVFQDAECELKADSAVKETLITQHYYFYEDGKHFPYS